MPHFTKLIDQTCLGAINFTDDSMNPREVTLTIKSVGSDTPPAGKKPRLCIWFAEVDKKCFLATGQVKRLANLLMKANTDEWIGARVTLTCGPVKSTKGGETMGMIVVRAENAKKSAPIAPAQRVEPSAS